MWYRVVGDAAMLAHFAFLAYLVVGGFLAWRWPWSIWVHVAVAVYGLFNVLVGWPCPLTHVENWGRVRAGEGNPAGLGLHRPLHRRRHLPPGARGRGPGAVAAVVLASWVGFGLRRRRAVRHGVA